jgi:Na+/pantothenate symporter
MALNEGVMVIGLLVIGLLVIGYWLIGYWKIKSNYQMRVFSLIVRIPLLKNQKKQKIPPFLKGLFLVASTGIEPISIV